MADFAPPPGPPPPKVPEGYKAIWNDQYKEWFFVNIYTKQSTWEKPTEPAYPPSGSDNAGPSDAPPGYDSSTKPNNYTGDDKSAMNSNNPYNGNNNAGSSSNMTEDERLARQMQAEEQSRNTGTPGASNSYYGGNQGTPQYGSPAPQYPQNQLPPRDEGGKKGGLFSSLKNKLGSSGGQRPMMGGGGYPPQHYGGYPQQPHYGGPPPMGYGGYPQPMYGGGYPPQQYGRRPGGGGMGAGGIALGAGAGLLGGAMLANSFNDNDAYQDGYQDGMDDGGDMGDMGGE